MSINHPTRDRVVNAILERPTGPFTYGDLRNSPSLKDMAPGTVSSVLANLAKAGVVNTESRNGQMGYLYTLLPRAGTLEEINARLVRMARRQYLARNQFRRRQQQPYRRQRPTPLPRVEGGLATLREAVDKAILYDRLLAYLNLSHAEVVATLKDQP